MYFGNPSKCRSDLHGSRRIDGRGGFRTDRARIDLDGGEVVREAGANSDSRDRDLECCIGRLVQSRHVQSRHVQELQIQNRMAGSGSPELVQQANLEVLCHAD